MYELVYNKNWIAWVEIIIKVNNCMKYILMSSVVFSNFIDNFYGDGCYFKECVNLIENKDK